MNPIRHYILKAAAALVMGTVPCLATAQTPPQSVAQPQTQVQPQAQPTTPKPPPAFYRNVVLIDPAHGGPDTGAHFANGILEKDVTLSFSARLRTLLVAAGFAVISTRDSDPAAILTTDQRASQANHARPLACLIVHVTASGSGLHLATSALTPQDPAVRGGLPWQTAQAATMPQSLRLANDLGQALQAAKLPAALLRTSVPPLDNLICPAVIIEIAPLAPSGAQPTAVTDSSYQQHTAEAIASALSSFRDQNAPSSAAAGAEK